MSYKDKIEELARAAADRDRDLAGIESALTRLSDAWAGAQKAEVASWIRAVDEKRDYGEEALEAIQDLNGICGDLGLRRFADVEGAASALDVAHAVVAEGIAGNRAVPPRSHGDGRDLADRGEDAAVRYLERLGYEILERDWACPAGEADIIARDGETLVFAEVKTRTGIEEGFPPDGRVGDGERSRCERIAMYYLRDCDLVDIPVRFDVVALAVLAEDRALIRHYVNALGTPGRE